MQTLLLANNTLGVEVGRHLKDRGELVGLVIHPPERRRRGHDFEALGVDTWEWPADAPTLAATEPDCVLSVLFGYQLPQDWLELAAWKPLNLHPGYLPWNRGAAPNVWPLVDGSPAGTTLHVMEREIDMGDILAQRLVPTFPDDTGETLYRRLERESMNLFREVWPRVRSLQPRPQPSGGSHHRMADLRTLDLDPDDLGVIDKVRARTFEEYGAEFDRDGLRYRVRVVIEPVPSS